MNSAQNRSRAESTLAKNRFPGITSLPVRRNPAAST